MGFPGIGSTLTPRDVAEVAIGHAAVGVDRAMVRARLTRPRALVDDVLEAGVPTSGLNRGLGPLRNSQIPPELIGEFERYVIVSHAAALGAPLSRIEGTAALLARLNTLGSNLTPIGRPRRPSARGKQAGGRRIRAAVAGGDLAEDRRQAASVQDAVSLRTVPQVHGALVDRLAYLERMLVVESNCAADNAFPDLERGVFVSNGKVPITSLAIGFDALRIGLAHLAKLAERRVSLLVTQLRQGFSLADQVQAVTAATGHVAPAILARTASAPVAQAKHAAGPISLTGTTVGDGVQDHSSMAYPSVRVTEQVLDVVERLLAVEALLATVISVQPDRDRVVLEAPVERLRAAIIEVTGRTQVTAEVIEWVIEALRRERRGDDLAEMRAPAVPPPVAIHDQEVARHDQLH